MYMYMNEKDAPFFSWDRVEVHPSLPDVMTVVSRSRFPQVSSSREDSAGSFLCTPLF